MLSRIISFIWKIRIEKKSSHMAHCGANFRVGSGFVITGGERIYVGDNFSAGKNLILATYEKYKGISTGIVPKLEIGNNVSFMDNCAISCAKSVAVGDGVLFGANVFVTDNFHGRSVADEMDIPPNLRALYVKGSVIIGNNVWVGRNVCIMPGVTIGDSAVIGANAVVTCNVPPRTIVGGVPARVIRKIESDI